MAVQYIDPNSLTPAERAELKDILNQQLKEIRDKLKEIEKASKKSKKGKKSKKAKG